VSGVKTAVLPIIFKHANHNLSSLLELSCLKTSTKVKVHNRHASAHARRLYLHLLAGGQVSARDLERIIANFEELEQCIDDLLQEIKK